MSTAAPDKAEGKLVASCDMVSSEFAKFEGHKVVAQGGKPAGDAKTAAGSTTRPKFRLGDGE
jgi:hypothetical protein